MWWFVWIGMNVVGYTLMGIDKRRGSFGVYAGMQQFRHKTKHWSFKIGIPCLMVIQLLLVSYGFQMMK